MTTPTPATGTPIKLIPEPAFHVWVDLSQHIGQARAVAHVASDYLPTETSAEPMYDQINRLCDLIFAIESLLTLANVDCEKIERLLPKGA